MIGRLLSSSTVQLVLARLAVKRFPRVLRLGKTAFVFRWNDVAEILTRDDDFRIEPINKARIEGVSGPFFLGMDRGPEYFKQRQHGYHAFAPQISKELLADIEKRARLCLTEAISNAKEQKVDVVGDVIRPVAAQTAIRVFGISNPDMELYLETIRAVFHETFLNLSNDKKVAQTGQKAGRLLQEWTVEEIKKRRRHQNPGDDFTGQLVQSMPNASDEEIAHIIDGYLVGAIDTTTTATTQALYEILAERHFKLVVKKDLDNPRRLLGWTLEALRLRPHNPVVLRETFGPQTIAGKTLPDKCRVFAVTLSAMQDPDVFLNPKRLLPKRELSKYMHFGYGPHVCAGRDLNAIQIPLLIKTILSANPTHTKKFKTKGPFPNQMMVTFKEGSHA